MAGMRIGYAIGQADTVKPLAQLKMPYNVSVFGVAAAIASLNDPKHIADERARNTEVRAFTVQGARGPGLQAGRLAGQLPLRRHRPPGEGVPRRVREAGRDGRPRLPAVREDATAASRSARWTRCRRRSTVFRTVLRPVTTTPAGDAEGEEASMLTRRRFVQTVGIGAAGATGPGSAPADARTASGRPSSRRSKRRRQPAHDLPLEQREPARARRKAVLDAVKAAFGRPARRPAATRAARGELIDAIAKKHGVKPENIVLGCGSTQILRIGDASVHRARTRRWSARFPTYEECAGYADMMGNPVRAGGARRRVQDRSRQARRRGEGRGTGLLLQPEQPDGDLRRRAGDARLPRAG